MFSNAFYFFENCAIRKVKRENVVQPGEPQMTIWGMRFSCLDN